MQTTGITFETEANRMKFTEQLSWTDMASDCTGRRLNIDAALDYSQGSIIRENI